jgi:dihydroneopterin aldolase
MKLLLKYLKQYRWRVIAALGLAATNQIFSLMDPYIFRKIIDDVAAVYRAETHTIYDFIRETIAQRMAQGHIHLQETLVDDLARTLLAHPKVRAVRISSEKPDVYPDCDAVGVEIFHIKES